MASATVLASSTMGRSFTLRPTADGASTVVVSYETQVGLLAWLGRAFLAPRLHAANQAMFDDLDRAAARPPLTARRWDAHPMPA